MVFLLFDSCLAPRYGPVRRVDEEIPVTAHRSAPNDRSGRSVSWLTSEECRPDFVLELASVSNKGKSNGYARRKRASGAANSLK